MSVWVTFAGYFGNIPHKGLSVVERAFRTMKTVALKVRPIRHRLADRMRAHLLICMPAYYVEYRMRECLAPMMFDDVDGPQRGKRRQRRRRPMA